MKTSDDDCKRHCLATRQLQEVRMSLFARRFGDTNTLLVKHTSALLVRKTQGRGKSVHCEVRDRKENSRSIAATRI